jgi:BirA family biotin operon repressor/biotin-[acetyl-CoA-carboxylase] ligase
LLYCAPKVSLKNGYKNLLSIQFKYHFINQLDSTNNFIKNYPVENGLVLFTNFQSSGKGMAANQWESKEGENLLCSILLEFPFIKIEQQAFINMAVCLALQAIVNQYSNKKSSIKWPNDIYIENKKIAGILIENTLQGSKIKQTIIGVGLNINQESFENKNAISLKNILNHNLNIETVLYDLTNQLNSYYQLLALGKYQQIIEKYNGLLFRKNETCYFNINKQLVLGQIESVNEYGLLKVLIGNELQEFAHKELEMII